MEINEFGKQILEYVGSSLGKDVKVSLKTITKNNGYVDLGLIICKGSVNPVIYLKEYYCKYADDPKGIEKASEEILKAYEISKEHYFSEELDHLNDWEYVKGKLRARLLNRDMNLSFQASSPYREYLDLIVVPYICLGNDSDGYAVRVTNALADLWETNDEKILETAIRNSIGQEPLLCSMESMIGELIGVENVETEVDRKMYVLTSPAKLHGSIHMLNEHLFEMLGERLEKSFFVLPSSVHELILVDTDRSEADAEGLSKMVREINEMVLQPEDVLSDHAYYWNQEERRMEAA